MLRLLLFCVLWTVDVGALCESFCTNECSQLNGSPRNECDSCVGEQYKCRPATFPSRSLGPPASQSQRDDQHQSQRDDEHRSQRNVQSWTPLPPVLDSPRAVVCRRLDALVLEHGLKFLQNDTLFELLHPRMNLGQCLGAALAKHVGQLDVPTLVNSSSFRQTLQDPTYSSDTCRLLVAAIDGRTDGADLAAQALSLLMAYIDDGGLMNRWLGVECMIELSRVYSLDATVGEQVLRYLQMGHPWKQPGGPRWMAIRMLVLFPAADRLAALEELARHLHDDTTFPSNAIGAMQTLASFSRDSDLLREVATILARVIWEPARWRFWGQEPFIQDARAADPALAAWLAVEAMHRLRLHEASGLSTAASDWQDLAVRGAGLTPLRQAIAVLGLSAFDIEPEAFETLLSVDEAPLVRCAASTARRLVLSRRERQQSWQRPGGALASVDGAEEACLGLEGRTEGCGDAALAIGLEADPSPKMCGPASNDALDHALR